jgi:D-alanyl-D-alanine carboxypeptidase
MESPDASEVSVTSVASVEDAPEFIIQATATPIAEPSSISASSTPVFAGPLSPPCGVLMSPLPIPVPAGVTELPVSDAARAALRAATPAAAWPALQRLLDAPGTVGLVAYQAGRESEGVYLNGDAPMPLASVAKIAVLVAYVEAVVAGGLNPLEQIPLAELERYYIPNFDLGAHRRAITELRQNDRVLSPDDIPAVLLEDVAWMMIRHSSNAAADYLHLRLGQLRIEETVLALGLNEPQSVHSAPCPFVSQFLMMGNHARGMTNNRAVLESFLGGDPGSAAAYGREASLLADAYTNQAAFRKAELDWRARTRQPSIDVQRYFAEQLAPQGTAGRYAALMHRLAQNGLSNADSSFLARRILEWPNVFPANQETFSNVGYKNGSLPGVLTTAYYAYRWGDDAPVIVVLFYRNLRQQVYRQWRFDLPHDELARWLLADPEAIPFLAASLRDGASP